jgi:hypothetical protein
MPSRLAAPVAGLERIALARPVVRKCLTALLREMPSREIPKEADILEALRASSEVMADLERLLVVLGLRAVRREWRGDDRVCRLMWAVSTRGEAVRDLAGLMAKEAYSRILSRTLK